MTDKQLVLSVYPNAYADFGWKNVSSVAIVNFENAKMLSSRFWMEEDAWKRVANKIKEEMLKKLEQ